MTRVFELDEEPTRRKVKRRARQVSPAPATPLPTPGGAGESSGSPVRSAGPGCPHWSFAKALRKHPVSGLMVCDRCIGEVAS